MAERVTLFPTCVVDTATPNVGVAAVRVLRRCGFDVDVPRDATCCGQPAWNAGFVEEAAKVARATLDALDATDGVICVPAGSCATMIRVFWPELFERAGDHDAMQRAERVGARVREFSELVSERAGADMQFRGGVVGEGAPSPTELDADLRGGVGGEGAPSPTETGAPSPARRVAYHHSCHMLRELGLRDQPLELLKKAGCDVVAWSGDDRCCGFGGLFSMKQPETSVAMADDKLDALAGTGAEMLVGCDASCLLQLRGRMERRGDALPTKHLAEVLDEAADG